MLEAAYISGHPHNHHVKTPWCLHYISESTNIRNVKWLTHPAPVSSGLGNIQILGITIAASAWPLAVATHMASNPHTNPETRLLALLSRWGKLMLSKIQEVDQMESERKSRSRIHPTGVWPPQVQLAVPSAAAVSPVPTVAWHTLCSWCVVICKLEAAIMALLRLRDNN
jgi:hypothetical protein